MTWADIERKYMDRRTAKVQANRELAFIKLVFSWAYEPTFRTPSITL